MCDEHYEEDLDNYMRFPSLTRRQFAAASMGAGVAVLLPRAADAQAVKESDVSVKTPDGVADCCERQHLAITRVVGGALMAMAAVVFAEAGQHQVSIAGSGGESVVADSYGQGSRGIVLVAHGGYSSRAAWRPQAEALVSAGFRVLVLETRGAAMLAKGTETPCVYDASCMAVDVLAAVRYLRASGTRDIAVIGGSAGGGAAAQASVDAAPGEIAHIVLLAPMEIDAPEKVKAKTFYITARNDRGSGDQLRLPGIQGQFERAPEPRQFLVVDGSAHGQRMFDSPEGPRIMREILAFLARR